MDCLYFFLRNYNIVLRTYLLPPVTTTLQRCSGTFCTGSACGNILWNVVGWIFVYNLLLFIFQRRKNFENRLSSDKVIAVTWWSTFLGHRVFSASFYVLGWRFVYNLLLFPTVTNFENRLSSDKVIAINWRSTFLGHRVFSASFLSSRISSRALWTHMPPSLVYSV